jgi:hypothetical protein
MRQYIEQYRKKEQKGKVPPWSALKKSLSSTGLSTSYKSLPGFDMFGMESIDVDAIEILDKIGGGNFGEVFRYQFLFPMATRSYWRFHRNSVAGSLRSLLQSCDGISNTI